MTTEKPTWILMPAMAGPTLTEAALADCLAQSIPVRVLLVLQGVDPTFRRRFEAIAEQDSRLLVWNHDPPLPSLSATWNRALQFVWAVGGEEALVVNNDVRLHRRTVELLCNMRLLTHALFVTAVGVTSEQFAAAKIDGMAESDFRDQYGGPDFSCFLISRAGHEQYPFDEGFIPSYAEDCDIHRRYMLSGDGERIFSINLPYHHVDHGSGTLKNLPPEKRVALERRLGQSREYYARKWGGPINAERWTIPFDATTDQPGVTNPELQRGCLQAETEA